MKFCSSILSLCFAILCAPLFAQMDTASNQINWATSYEDALSKSKATSKPVLILFTGSTWCHACKKLENDVIRSPNFSNQVANKFVFLKADFVDASQEGMSRSPFKSLLDRYQVKFFPTMVVVDGEGRQLFIVNYQAGGSGPEAYVQELNQKLQSVQTPAMQ